VKERAFTLLCALGAVMLFVAMFVRREGSFELRNEIPRPTTVERRGNGYNAAFTWLNVEGVRSISLRDRFNKIADVEELPASGNLLIVTLPAVGGFKTEEFLPLDRWIRAGNTLLVLAALSDTPDWARTASRMAVGDLNLLTGLEFETAASRERRVSKRDAADAGDGSLVEESAMPDFNALITPHRATLVPNRPHPYFQHVAEVTALSDYTARSWTVKVPYQGFVLALARGVETGEGAIWTRPLGKGRIVVSGFGSIFTNRAMAGADNGRLLANIVAATVKEEGVVLFDDAHQGLGAAYDPQKFYKDRRLYMTAAIVMGLWLVWVLGSTRLRVPLTRDSTPREAELVRAAGSFLARVLPRHAAARRLLENFFRRVNERAQRRAADPPWELLERHPRVAAHDLDQLKHWYAQACVERPVPLGRLYNLLLRIDKATA
jgi:hypothetical protein